MIRAAYDKKIKMLAVKMSQSENKYILDTANGLGIYATSLRRWINEYDK